MWLYWSSIESICKIQKPIKEIEYEPLLKAFMPVENKKMKNGKENWVPESGKRGHESLAKETNQ